MPYSSGRFHTKDCFSLELGGPTLQGWLELSPPRTEQIAILVWPIEGVANHRLAT